MLYRQTVRNAVAAATAKHFSLKWMIICKSGPVIFMSYVLWRNCVRAIKIEKTKNRTNEKMRRTRKRIEWIAPTDTNHFAILLYRMWGRKLHIFFTGSQTSRAFIFHAPRVFFAPTFCFFFLIGSCASIICPQNFVHFSFFSFSLRWFWNNRVRPKTIKRNVTWIQMIQFFISAYKFFGSDINTLPLFALIFVERIGN